jgi:3-mercaptopyruvate sulfurtransferase SseA
MAWPRPLITPAELAPRLDAPELRLVECGVVYRPLPDRQDFRVESARPLYGAGHLPGAVFVDVVAELSDPASGLRFTMPEPARLEPRPRAGLFVDKAAVRRALGDSRAVVVNALSAEQHEGRGGVTYGRPGRIAGSVSVSARALTDPKTHAYLPPERIRAAFEAAGVLRPGGDAAGRRAVTYCGAGIAASSDAFLLTLLGMDDVAVYDGSLEEWARDPACPMESGPVAP